MNTILVSLCVSIWPNIARKTIQNRAADANFHIFRNNFACSRLVLIL